MSDESLTGWVRSFDIVVGLVALIAGIVVILESTFAGFIIILFLIASLFLIGLIRIARAMSLHSKGTIRRGINAVFGVAILGVIVYTLAVQNLSELLILQLIGLAWMFTGISRVLMALVEKDVERNYRITQIIVGFLTIALAFVIELSPVSDITILILFLGIIATLNGIARVARAYVGI